MDCIEANDLNMEMDGGENNHFSTIAEKDRPSVQAAELDDNPDCSFTIVNNNGKREDIRVNTMVESTPLRRKWGKNVTCLLCSKKFSQSSGRHNHMKRVHNIYPDEKSNVRCLEKGCLFTCSYKEKLQIHLLEEHGLHMDVTTKTFESMQEFLRWKDEFERQEKSRFVKKSGSRVRDQGFRVAYYYCSRSGSYTSHSRGVKRGKIKGTSKSNNHCTASITCIELPNGKMEVKLCSTHYGHDTDLRHLRLTQTEKFQIAEQLSNGLPRDIVLDNVRASVGTEVDRIHLITMKDVKNIEKSYGIQSYCDERRDSMFSNLNIWVSSIMQSPHCPVLHFSEEGLAQSKHYDITLILLTTGQVEMLNKFGNPGIFYVTTITMTNRSANINLGFMANTVYVTSMMLVDDLNEAVPVSFMLTNKLDSSKYSTFFENIKKVMPQINAAALLTDNRNDIFEEWCAAFKYECQTCHLWSNRFVDNDWRDNLICIPREDLQVSIYETLYSYLESTDEFKLHATLDRYIEELQANDITRSFGDYFVTKYLGSETLWAGCYGKKHIPVSAQLNMEMLCNDIEGATNKKYWDKAFLVKIVQHLLKVVSENQCARQSKLKQQVQELPHHHTLGLGINKEVITQESESCWCVRSVKDPTNVFSLVNKQTRQCRSEACTLSCVACKVCAHEYSCSCNVYAYDRTMCKHIHAVVIQFQTSGESETTECRAEVSSTDNNATVPDVVLIKNHFWNKIKSLKRLKKEASTKESESKSKNKSLTGELTLLPAIQDVLLNKEIKTERRKRGRPRKDKREDKASQSVKGKKGNISEPQNSSDSIHRKKRRINILRKCTKKHKI